MQVVIPEPDRAYTEEERSRRPTVFSALREIIAAFRCEDSHLGLYGAFGYDLAFQFEPIHLQRERPAEQRDLVLYLPDELIILLITARASVPPATATISRSVGRRAPGIAFAVTDTSHARTAEPSRSRAGPA